MTTLAEFLLARIAEDEAAARSATGGPWLPYEHNGDWGVSAPDGEPVAAWARAYPECLIGLDEDDATHIARHDPASVLAECEAKRRIVEAELLRVVGREADYVDSSVWAAIRARTSTPVLWLLADPYASHPDYPTEQAKHWRLT